MCVVPLAHPATASGQACVDPNAVRAGGSVGISVARYSYATAFSVSAAIGSRWRGSVSVGTTRDRDLRVSATTLGADLLRVVQLGGTGRFQLCPQLGFAAEFGPRYELLTPDDDVRKTAWSAGLQGRLALHRTTAIHLSITGSYRVWRMTSRYDHLGVRLREVTDTYSTLRAGVSITYRRWLTLTPEIGTTQGLIPPDRGQDEAAPFGHESGETSLSLSLAIALGKRVAAH